jgi:ABC-type methionine transport system ATPase subunit
MPLRLNNWPGKQNNERTKELLISLSENDKPGNAVWDKRRNLAHNVSGGQYQRVAIARALSHRPRLLFLDEPTAHLDPQTTKEALNILKILQRKEGVTVVMITHNLNLAARYADYIVEMDSPEPGLGKMQRRLRNRLRDRGPDESGEWWIANERWFPVYLYSLFVYSSG